MQVIYSTLSLTVVTSVNPIFKPIFPHPQCSLDYRETPTKPVSGSLYSHTQPPNAPVFSNEKIFWKHTSVHNHKILENDFLTLRINFASLTMSAEGS